MSLVESKEKVSLAVSHLDLAIAIARNFGKRNRHLWDEYESEAYVALWEAALSFDEGRGHTFYDHARFRISRRMFEVWNNWHPKGYRRNRRKLRTFEVISLEGRSGDLTHAEEILDRSPSNESAYDDKDFIRGMMSHLTDYQRWVLELVYVKYAHEENPQEKAAAELGCYPSAVCSTLKRARERIRVVAEGGKLSDAQRGVPPPNVACAVCGTMGGDFGRTNKNKPMRVSGERFGIVGELCIRCYSNLGARIRYHRSKQKAAALWEVSPGP